MKPFYYIRMKILLNSRKILLTISFAIITFIVSDPAQASVDVLDVQGSAWASSESGGVRRSLSSGDRLRQTDVLEVGSGDYIRLQLGGNTYNVIYIEGPAQIRMDAVFGKYFVEKGLVVAILDDLKEGDVFEIRSLTAVASARGTRFWVNQSENSYETIVFSGAVTVSLTDADDPDFSNQVIEAGEKFTVRFEDEEPYLKMSMNAAELRKFTRIVSLFNPGYTSQEADENNQNNQADDSGDVVEDLSDQDADEENDDKTIEIEGNLVWAE